MPSQTSADRSLAQNLIDRLQQLILEAERSTKPLEVDPYRTRLFELFVTAEASGCVQEDAENDLTAEGICRALARRWGLADATRESFEQQTKLPVEHLAKLRLLWSLMRMWMEWDYAWKRWPEFHRRDSNS